MIPVNTGKGVVELNAAQKIKKELDSIVGKYDVDRQKEWDLLQKDLQKRAKHLEPVDSWSLDAHYPDFTVTPAKAERLSAEYNLFLGQRNVTPARRDMIAAAVLTSTWHGNKVVVAHLDEPYKTPEGKETKRLLLNGGGTISASITYGLNIPYNTLLIAHCPTAKAASNLYFNMDRKESTRTASEMTKAILATEDDKDHWTDEYGRLQSTIYKNCITAANVAEYGPSYRQKKYIGSAEIARHQLATNDVYAKEIEWLKSYIYNHPTPKYMKRVVGVLGVMLLSHKVHGDACEYFWDDLREGMCADNPRMTGKSGSPQESLYQYLYNMCSCSMNKGKSPEEKRLRLAAKEDETTIFGKTLFMYNAWASGKRKRSWQGRHEAWPTKPTEIFRDFCPVLLPDGLKTDDLLTA